jgi:hypothetical protein
MALGLGVNQIELLQHVIYSKHVNWLKVWNFHFSQIIFSRIQQHSAAEHSTSSLSSGAVVCVAGSLGLGEAMKNGRKIIASPKPMLPRRLQAQRLLKNMKFEGIVIAQCQIPSSFQISSSISIPSNFIFFKSLCGGESHKFKLQIYAANKKYR